MVLDGVDVKTAQTRLGHSDPRLTLAIYAQATGEGDRSAANKLGARLMASGFDHAVNAGWIEVDPGQGPGDSALTGIF